MNSRIYIGEVVHHRLRPTRHFFRYPVYTYCFDLDELEELDKSVKGFGHNRFNLAAVHDRDYLKGEGSIRERLLRFLDTKGCGDGIARIEMVSMARFLNYVFNPVTFYYCYRQDESLRCVAAEVSNTFREKHLYILDQPLSGPGAWPARFVHAKEFHVSPFNSMAGYYQFFFSRLDEKLNIGLVLVREGKRVLVARLSARALPLTSENLRRTVLRYPLTAMLNFPRISWQAAKLHYNKKLRWHTRPNPASPMTIGTRPPGPLERLGMRIMLGLLSRLRNGCLVLRLPDGTEQAFGDAQSEGRQVMALHNYALFRRVLIDGDIGFGESYMAGDWDSDDVTGVLAVFIANREVLEAGSAAVSGLARFVSKTAHLLRRNTLTGSRRNIEAHYDLGNNFFETFLDPETMFYSCGIYRMPDDSLATAQRNKAAAIIAKAGIKATDHVLEIGCGWGGFAIQAVQTTDCRLTGITLSREQRKLAMDRIEAARLASRIDIQLVDYRRVEGQFDKIVSIEMLEAVGHEYFGTFFATCDRLLKPGGRLVLQVITIPDERYEKYRRSTDWIQKHIFPGGLLPSLPVLEKAANENSSLRIAHVEDIGLHYPRILREWRERFEARHDRLLEMDYGEAFQRKWRYYFCYCEAGFAAGYINDLHIVLKKPE